MKILDENSQNLLDQNPPTAFKQGEFYKLQMDLEEDLTPKCKEKISKIFFGTFLFEFSSQFTFNL